MDTNHPKWQKTLRKILDCIKVYKFSMDEYSTVLVSGRTNPYVLLNKIGKAGKRAELVLLQSGECSGCLNMPSSSSAKALFPLVVTDDIVEDGRRQYANDYNCSRRYDPYYNYGGGGYGYSYGYDGLGNGGGYGGWGGYNVCPRPAHGPFGKWVDPLLDPNLNTSSGW